MPALDNAARMFESGNSIQPGALRGIRVLDLSRVLAGPWATQLLADFGADVIKVERPRSGDDTRGWGPPWLAGEGSDSAYFLSTNRNKRSMTVNLASPSGQEIVRSLAAQSDVLVENFRVGTLARFGLDYETLRQTNDRLIYCSISAYGQSGSRSHLPGYDATMQASGGLMSITGAPDAEGGSPQKVGVAISDIMTGMYATSAVLAALVARNENGRGQRIDLALYDSQIAWLANQNMNYLVGGMVPGRQGTGHPNIVPYQVFATSDGDLMLAVGNNQQFNACLDCLGLEQLKSEEKYATNQGRVLHRDELTTILAKAFAEQPTQHWLDRLNAAGVPAAPVNSIADIFDDAYAAERNFVRHLPRDGDTAIPTVANPVNFSQTPVQYDAAPPALGQHTQEILRSELGMDEARIAALAENGDI